MTSSVHNLSESSGPNEQQNQSQPEMQSQPPANGNVQPGMATPAAEYLMPRSHLDVGPSMAPAAYPYIDPYYGSIIAAYGGQSVIHPHLMGVLQPGVPLPTDAVEEPVYVNAKQYHGILRRRQSRAKAESENKVIKTRKPYLHESRHQHALKRARGCGGRFLNSKSKGEDQEQDKDQPCNGPTSENPCSEDRQGAAPSLNREHEAKHPASSNTS